MCLFEETAFALQEGAAHDQVSGRPGGGSSSRSYICSSSIGNLHGAVAVVLDRLDLDLPTSHVDGGGETISTPTGSKEL